MYRTRNGLILSAPRPIFGWLAFSAVLNMISIVALYVLIFCALLAYLGFLETVARSIVNWTFVVILFGTMVSWMTLGLVVGLGSNDIEIGDKSVISTFKDVGFSAWGRATGLTVVTSATVLFILGWQNVWIGFPVSVLLVLTVLCRLLRIFATESNRELHRVMKSSGTSPMYVQSGGYIENCETREFRQKFGPDWADPDVVHDVRVAKKFEEAASSRARTLFILGRALAWTSAPILIATFTWCFRENRPGFAVSLPIFFAASLILGWWLERRSRSFDTLVDEYRKVPGSERSSMIRKNYCTMTWIEKS